MSHGKLVRLLMPVEHTGGNVCVYLTVLAETSLASFGKLSRNFEVYSSAAKASYRLQLPIGWFEHVIGLTVKVILYLAVKLLTREFK